ncbi:helix-turn-helix transcriptional regulator [Pseudonocardia alni]|uniref:helix-turn-helix transcriptional regulator n=1 Tax=Pseudonocardia alni TaxID=33907 RepID=UPI0033F88FFF
MRTTLDYMTPDQLATELQVTVKQLENWRRRGYGPPFVRLSPHCVRYSRQKVAQWLGRCEANPLSISSGGEQTA